jgi:hypothetical protein
MPYIDFDDPAVWAEMYNPPYERANREVLFSSGMKSARDLRLALEARGMLPTHKIALIGGGYGWVAEEWIAAGYQSLIVCDTSSYIQSNKAQHAVVTIHAEGADSNGSRGNIRQLLGNARNSPIDWAVTEDVLPCFTDAEIGSYAPQLRQLARNVAHWVTPKSPGNYMTMNWKTVEEWKALLTPDLIVARGSDTAV